MFKNIFTYFVCVIFSVSYINASESGSACQVHGASGQCLPARECLSAKGSICSNQKELHVCCATDTAPDSHTPTTRRSTDGCDPLTSLTALKVGQKSWNKCLEY